jgi:hypothetical protein
MDSRQRFVVVYAMAAMVPFTVLSFLNTNDFGLFFSAYTLEYFALRFVLNPKMRFRVDVLGLALLALFVYLLWLSAKGILGVALP